MKTLIARMQAVHFSPDRAFPGQQEGERIFIIMRKYPLAYLPKLILSLALLFVPLVIIIVLAIIGLLPPAGPAAQTLYAAMGIYLMFVIAITTVSFLTFYYSLNVVTDRRLVSIEQKSLFRQEFSEVTLDDIEDVNSFVEGFFPSLFDFGNIEAQTAGARNRFELVSVRQPRQVSHIIVDLSDQAKAGIGEQSRRVRGDIKGMIGSRDIANETELLEFTTPREGVLAGANHDDHARIESETSQLSDIDQDEGERRRGDD